MGRPGFAEADRRGFGILLRNSTEFKEQPSEDMCWVLSRIFFGRNCNQLRGLTKMDDAS